MRANRHSARANADRAAARSWHERDHRFVGDVALAVRDAAAARRRRPTPGGRFLADAARVARGGRRGWRPDAVVVIGPDHFHANFYDVMPPFVLGVEEAGGVRRLRHPPGPLPVAAELAWPIRDGLAAAGFDVVAVVRADRRPRRGAELRHGRRRPPIPLVPLVVNTAAPPLPALDRCVALGRGAGRRDPRPPLRRAGAASSPAAGCRTGCRPTTRAIRRSPASGGRRVIHGRRDVRRLRRRPRAAGAGDGRRPERAGQRRVGPLVPQAAGRRATWPRSPSSATRAWRRTPGSGGHEVRTWLVGLAAAGGPLRWTELRAGAGVDHRDGHRHDLRGELTNDDCQRNA